MGTDCDALSSRHNAELETDLSPGESVITLCSSSSLALMLGQIPTPQKEAYFAVILGNTKCAQSLNKVSELVIRSHNFGTSPGHANVFSASPVLSNPFHYHKPDKFGGQHRLVGQNANTFNLHLAVNSLPAMGAHERPLFEKLLWGLVSSTIFVRC
jgi:hypothetical protein